jgi:2-oxoacid:acceptor oxidoreductase gamma subunit (pyruvate/2-ketoisovalerate family)
MIEIRWHGRGGQGVVTSSNILANAAIREGKFAMHIPEFGPERRGAPVRSYTRIDDNYIDIRFGVISPDIVVVIDPTLITYKDMILEGLRRGGITIFNCRDPKVLEDISNIYSKYYVDAYRISLDIIGRPIYNTTMLGALVGVTRIVKPDSVVDVIKERFGGKIGELNIKAFIKGMEEVESVG